ncbi:hypothetical protein VOLCADRAFT_102927 [Volvox carteri f. nagariensis]|uniref:Uncharacterized protein n=1 Tax=Volvox carteri f. nagariensis TaxID=3068 RepID=D8TGV6_VOLCA|nr:uncharacterized protein VOLCADRAFT_102927 [Volvox carteri f. nagariensis]EFJ53326.1 hypothetical protein VOLCADRAFT_102927 [Volvox carteri f. nagariensis]|eukprot:XP_002946331.1 hypothetical protein VOLCADRAFT_102927 [Volvox carteri f. nagariensis]
MKKTTYHVNPAVNKWEEEQRRLRMEKMIQRAKSTLPPEARGASKPAGQKKPSPYAAENNKPIRKRSTGGVGTPGGAVAMDVQELDSLIYNRVQEILGMPLMRRAAVARDASKGPTPQRTPASARGGRRPAWNNDWSAQAGSPPLNNQERPSGGGGPRSGASSTPCAFLGVLTGHRMAPCCRSPRILACLANERGQQPRPASSRYGSAAGALPSSEAEQQAGELSGQLLEQSMVAAIEALNPQASAAREASNRNAQHYFAQRGSRDVSLMQSVTAAAGPSQGGSAGAVAHEHTSCASKGDADAAEEDEDAYADDDFEDYDGTDDEHERAAPPEAEPDAEVEAEDDSSGAAATDIALLRNSVNALNGLVKLKIQQELARSQQQQQQGADHEQIQDRQLLQAGHPMGPSTRRQMASPEMLASLPLVGSEERNAREAPGPGGRDRTTSSLGDGLRQSDLDYLARLGGAEPQDGPDVATSTDERPFVIEPGAPAGTAKAWGDRQPWLNDKGAEAGPAGLLKLRARQERERQMQEQQVVPADGQRLSRQGLQGEGRLFEGRPEPANPPSATRGKAAAPEDEEDTVLLGETVTPRNRTGAAAQMQAVSNALAVLASSGQLSPSAAQELRNQTDALYGSLVQLHDLMNGPRGAELCTSSPSRDNAAGFTPTALSPDDSPSQSLRQPTGALAAPQSQPQGGPVKAILQKGAESSPGSKYEAQPKPTDVVHPPGGSGAHLQLTPKHRLIAEDIAWMAGLAQSLSKSLQVDKGEVELPGI